MGTQRVTVVPTGQETTEEAQLKSFCGCRLPRTRMRDPGAESDENRRTRKQTPERNFKHQKPTPTPEKIIVEGK